MDDASEDDASEGAGDISSKWSLHVVFIIQISMCSVEEGSRFKWKVTTPSVISYPVLLCDKPCQESRALISLYALAWPHVGVGFGSVVFLSFSGSAATLVGLIVKGKTSRRRVPCAHSEIYFRPSSVSN